MMRYLIAAASVLLIVPAAEAPSHQVGCSRARTASGE